jgi:hypothetical protein
MRTFDQFVGQDDLQQARERTYGRTEEPVE